MRRRAKKRIRRTERFLSIYPPEPLPLAAVHCRDGEYPETIRVSFTNGHTATYQMNGYVPGYTPWKPVKEVRGYTCIRLPAGKI